MIRALATMAMIAAAGCSRNSPTVAAKGPTVLDVYLWEDSIPEDVLEKFQKETGIAVRAEYFSDLATLERRVRQDPSRFDLITPSDYMVEELAGKKLLMPLPATAAPMKEKITTEFSTPWYDRELVYCLPYQWSLSGLAYNKDYVKDPPRRWADVLDPVRASAWAGRMSLLNDSRETFGIALLAEGVSPESKEPERLTAAAARLRSILPMTARFDSDRYEDGLISGSLWICHGYNGDLARAEKENPAIEYIIPEEGALMSVDNLAIPIGSKRPEAALKLMEYLFRSSVAYRLVEAQGLAGTVAQSREALQALPFRQSTVFGLPAGEKTYILHPAGEEAEMMGKLWSEILKL
jgi:spermidine/putrescine transport system substrate-binding protein